jgi:hypothetical protein
VKAPCIAGHEFFTPSLHRNKDQVITAKSAKNALLAGDFTTSAAELASQAEKICRCSAAQVTTE